MSTSSRSTFNQVFAVAAVAIGIGVGYGYQEIGEPAEVQKSYPSMTEEHATQLIEERSYMFGVTATCSLLLMLGAYRIGQADGEDLASTPSTKVIAEAPKP